MSPSPQQQHQQINRLMLEGLQLGSKRLEVKKDNKCIKFRNIGYIFFS